MNAPSAADFARAEVDHETIALTAHAWAEFLSNCGFYQAAMQLDEMFSRHYSLSMSCNRRY